MTPNCHTRSNSLPSTSHPLTSSVEVHLQRLKALETSNSSLSASSICNNLSSLKDLHDLLNDLIQLPSIQQALLHERRDKWADEVFNGSLALLDVYGTTRDVLLNMKESVQELQSSLRRKRDIQSGLPQEIGAYTISRKKANKIVFKCFQNMKHIEKNYSSAALVDTDSNLVTIISILKEVETISFSILSEEQADCQEVEKIDGALYALTIQKSSGEINFVAEQNVLKQLQTLAQAIQELEEGLEAIFGTAKHPPLTNSQHDAQLQSCQILLVSKSNVSKLVLKAWLEHLPQDSKYSFSVGTFSCAKKKAPNCHTRSNSLPLRSHPLAISIEDHLHRLKALEAGTSSSSASLICNNLSSIKDLHELLNDLIQLPSIQQVLFQEQRDKWTDDVLDGSLALLDVYGTTRDALLHMKESVQELESSLRRKRGTKLGLADEIGTYMISRKKANKMVSKRIQNLENFEKNYSSSLLEKDSNFVAIISILREVETINCLILKSILSYVSGGTKARSSMSNCALVAKFIKPKRVSHHREEQSD
ncbi:unnamed protein product [Ilex paraguariensis]|uniref:Uncharacterized protein n=1 Tax=Ilex paraguariensis TaxID=185542 RepID=A0ABC8U9A6_9AQUA